MQLVRRDFLSLLARGTTALLAVAAFPSWVMARHNEAFAQESLADAIARRYPGMTPVDSDQVIMDAPKIAQDGSKVAVKVSSSLDNPKSLSLFVEENPFPMSCSYIMKPRTILDFDIRIRMAKTSKLVAIIETQDGNLYQTSQEVKVTIGGCGG